MSRTHPSSFFSSSRRSKDRMGRRNLLREIRERADRQSNGSHTEVAFRERAAGPGLQIPLEASSSFPCRELENHDGEPRSVGDGDAARTFVMPLQTSIEILSDSDVVPIRIAAATQDVDASA